MSLIWDGGTVIGWKPTNPTQRTEVLQAPDDGSGGPATASEISLAILAPGITAFFYRGNGPSLTRFHYRVRHILPGYEPGTASKYIRGHGVVFDSNPYIAGVQGTLSNSLLTSGQTPNALWVHSGGPITPYAEPAQFAIRGTLNLETAQTTDAQCAHFEALNTVATVQTVCAVMGVARTTHTSGTVSLLVGIQARPIVNVAGGITSNVRAFNAKGVVSAGTVTNFVSFYGEAPDTGATFSNHYRFYAEGVTSGTNRYGIYLNDVSGGTLNYAIYTNAGTIRFGGAVVLDAPIRLKAYTVATLPAGTQGDSAFVTDALAPTFLAALVGGGAVVTPSFFDGTSWVAF